MKDNFFTTRSLRSLETQRHGENLMNSLISLWLCVSVVNAFDHQFDLD
jgi:hypothetical protein